MPESDSDVASGTRLQAPTPIQDMEWSWVAAAFDAAPFGMAIIDLEAKMLRVNHPLSARLESSETDLVGRSLGDLLPPHHEQSLRQIVARSFDRHAGKLRTVVATKGGRPIPCELTVSPLTRKDAEHPQALVMMEVQVEEKRDLEAQSRLQSLVSSSSDAIFGTNAEGFITHWNAGAEQIFGYASADILWKPVALLVRGDTSGFGAHVQRVMRGGTVKHAEVRCVHQQGGIVDVEMSLAPILNGNARISGISIIARDVTELNRLREETARNRERAIEMEQHAKMAELKTAFLNGAAHELGTPLTPIMIQLHMLRRAEGLPPGLAQTLNVLDRNLSRLGLLVNNIVTATRLQMEDDRDILQKKPMDLAATIQHAVAVHRSVALQKGVNLELAVDRKLNIVGDAERLYDVLVNFLSNAIRFTPAGKTVKVEAMEGNGNVAVHVHDEGPGFAPSDLAHLFQPFGRAVIPGVNVGDGTGLGLFISRAIIERHHGRIAAYSDGAGKGAVFTFEIPTGTGA